MLQSYFRSGWAFLIPYLAAYLLYAWLKWPVNPVTGGPWTVVPCLLHVYWVLHAIHLILAIIALRSWWRISAIKHHTSTGAQSALPPSTADRLLSTGYSLLPWLCLALIFGIPGLYLEWPSDPWEHLRRINEWHILDKVTSHSSWEKSSYFIPFSLTRHTTDLLQLSWLNFYYTSTCLMLSWQYYLLARAVGLGQRASFIFVLLNALTFGNNIFSFYRYYGLSSSILAQIGAIALTRITIEATGTWPMKGVHEQKLHSLRITCYSQLRAAGAVLALLTLIAFNHIQGIGIAGLGILAVLGWRLIEWKRSMIGWLAAATVLLSIATTLWFPRHPLLDSELRDHGWIAPWYGFNHLIVGSPAFYNMIGAIGVFGVFGLVAGLFLLRQNNVVGWLTVAPFLILACPAFAIPFASAIPEGITVYSRMFLAAPAGLALVIVGRTMLLLTHSARDIESNHIRGTPAALVRLAAVCGILSTALATPSSNWVPNRVPQFLTISPDDLQLKALLSINPALFGVPTSTPCRLIAPAPVASAIHTLHPRLIGLSERRDCIGRPVTGSIFSALTVIASNRPMHSGEVPSLNKDPYARGRENWISLETDAAEFITIEGFSTGRTALQNPAGRPCTVLTAELIPIDPMRAYFVEISVRQQSTTKATARLVIAWYDATGRFLESSAPSPHGAGSPEGWGNGTFSYFGLVQEVAPAKWTTYRISMGSGEPVSIPNAAAFLRVGAILNDSPIADARIQLTGVHVWPKRHGMKIASGTFPDNERACVLLVSPMLLTSPLSYSAYLSRHWPVNQVASDMGGGAELSALARAAARGPAPVMVNIGIVDTVPGPTTKLR